MKLPRMMLPWATWTREQWWYFGIFVALLLLWPGIVYLRGGPNLSSVIYWLTALVVLAYTVETYGMRLEMVRQNALTIEPLVLARIGVEPVEGTQQNARQLILYNIGNGPALSVRLDDITFKNAPELAVHFLPADIIRKDAQAICAAEGVMGEQKFVSFVPALDPQYANATYEVTIRYADLTGVTYYTAMQMGKGGIRFLGHGKA